MMIERYTYRVVWSPTYRKYFARCLEIPTLTSLGTTQQDALDQVSRLAADFVDAEEDAKETVAQQHVSGGNRDTWRRTGPSSNLRYSQRVVPRWHTRC